eukprot:2793956-Rhodomonas_salina.1
MPLISQRQSPSCPPNRFSQHSPYRIHTSPSQPHLFHRQPIAGPARTACRVAAWPIGLHAFFIAAGNAGKSERLYDVWVRLGFGRGSVRRTQMRWLPRHALCKARNS